jgi:hypothetical protein
VWVVVVIVVEVEDKREVMVLTKVVSRHNDRGLGDHFHQSTTSVAVASLLVVLSSSCCYFLKTVGKKIRVILPPELRPALDDCG